MGKINFRHRPFTDCRLPQPPPLPSPRFHPLGHTYTVQFNPHLPGTHTLTSIVSLTRPSM